MVTLFDSTRRVKASRKPAPRFGEGILDHRMPYTAADLEWADYELNTDGTDYDVVPDYDRMAGEWVALDRLEKGCYL
jgi:hypothetical protein